MIDAISKRARGVINKRGRAQAQSFDAARSRRVYPHSGDGEVAWATAAGTTLSVVRVRICQ